MIIKKFEEIVQRFPDKTALKTKSKSLTYAELDSYANRVAHAISLKSKEQGTGVNGQQVALLFEHGIDMIAAVIGTLKANKTYVPLDIYYPGKRLLYIIENSETYLLLTDNRNLPLALELSDHSGNNIDVINIETIGDEIPSTTFRREASEERTTYILYTSGSTGKPKGVFQLHRNVLYYTRNWMKRFSITEADRMSLFTAFTHDGAVQDIFSALLSGACLYPCSIKESRSMEEYYQLLAEEKITIWHSVPSLFRSFTSPLALEDRFPDVRWVLLGGEPLRALDLELYKPYFPNAYLANVYGQTESSVSSICVITPQDTFDDISLGKPLEEMEILLLDEDGDMVEEMGGGEIVVNCDYIAPGYWKDKENSEKVFLHDEQRGRLYMTGDMGRLTARGAIKVMGRKDLQVKIRGFRVEPGEIETVLLQHGGLNEAVVTLKEGGDDNYYLCAYVVSDAQVSNDELREYLSGLLPNYMVPRYFIPLENMPVTGTGKIDRKALPEPDQVELSKFEYEEPTNDIERKIAEIWQEVLKIEKIGINDNFIELGGHSLLVISIITSIHKTFEVDLQLNDVFENPTIKQLARLVMKSKKTVYSSIGPVEEKEYYPMSYQQKGLYFIQKFEPGSISYNMPIVSVLKENLQRKKIEGVLRKLIKRHKILRTSFEIVNDNPVQRVHHDAPLEIEYYVMDEEEAKTEVMKYIKPFDLSVTPLMRVMLIKLSDEKHIIILDFHHIITDTASHMILIDELMELYSDEKKELNPLRIHYSDYSQWHSQLSQSGELKRQEEYWLNRFSGELPVLKMTTDFPRQAEKNLKGGRVQLQLDRELSSRLKKYISETGSTHYIFMLTIYTILLSKYSGQDDIVVGSPVSGRTHPDLYNIVGLFANMMAMRNFPKENIRFRDFFEQVKTNTVNAFDNQDYQFTELVSKLGIPKDLSRHPLFDAVLALENMTARDNVDKNLPMEPFYFDFSDLKFDLLLDVLEGENFIFFSLNYSVSLFKPVTAKKMLQHLVEILGQVLEDDTVMLKDIKISHQLMRVESVFSADESNAFEF